MVGALSVLFEKNAPRRFFTKKEHRDPCMCHTRATKTTVRVFVSSFDSSVHESAARILPLALAVVIHRLRCSPAVAAPRDMLAGVRLVTPWRLIESTDGMDWQQGIMRIIIERDLSEQDVPC